MTADVDIIILTWNDGDLLGKAVCSALEASQDLSVRVIVVDNASDAAPVMPADPRIDLVMNTTNRGVAGGRNDGVVESTAPLICFLDSDAELHQDSLTGLVDVIKQDSTIGVVVPVFTDQAPEESAGRAPTLRVKLERMAKNRSSYEPVRPDARVADWDVDFGIGACQLLRRTAYDHVGGLDERLWWAEDADFCLRLREVGWRVVQTDRTRVDHPPRRRFNKPLSKKGFDHSVAVTRSLWRHRSYRSVVADRVTA